MSTRAPGKAPGRIGRWELIRLATEEGQVVVCDSCGRALNRDGRCSRCEVKEYAGLVNKGLQEPLPPGGWELADLVPILAGKTAEQAPSMLLRTDSKGLVYPGKVHVIAGEPEAGKGLLALAGCAERMGLGEHVLHLDFEDTPETAVARLRALGVPDPLIYGLFHYASPQDPLQGDIRQLVPPGTTLAVVDGVTEAMTLHGLKMLDNTDVATFLALLARPMAAAGAAVLLLDHVSRDREARGRGAIGAQHKLAGVDVSYMLDIVRPFGRGLEGLSRLTVTKDRPGFIRATSAGRKLAADLELYSENEDLAVLLKPISFDEPDPLGLTPAGRRVLNALPSAHPGSSPQEIGDRVVEQGWEAGLHRVTIQKELRRLAESGLADSADARWWRCSPDAV
jgi:hypothetical protein